LNGRIKVNELYIDGAGLLLLKKSKKARRLIMSLKDDGMLTVAIPYWVSYKEAKKIISSNPLWVKKYILKMEERKIKNGLLPKNNKVSSHKEAILRLKDRAKKIAEQNGFSFGKISVRDQRTRWGSCSLKNNISLNAKLRHLPDQIIDYVILHEFVHTRIKNHKQSFWDEMAKYLDSPKKLDGKLKEYEPAFLC